MVPQGDELQISTPRTDPKCCVHLRRFPVSLDSEEGFVWRRSTKYVKCHPKRTADCVKNFFRVHNGAVKELSGHVLGYSIQTANSFDVLSVAGGGDHVLSCREVQDLQVRADGKGYHHCGVKGEPQVTPRNDKAL